MARSVSELLDRWLDGSISEADHAELRDLCESNSMAREELIHRAGRAGRDPAELLSDLHHPAEAEGESESAEGEHPGSILIEPERKTSLTVRLMCAAMLAIILFGLFATPFLRVKASLLKVVDGQLLSAMGNPMPTLEDGAMVTVPAGVTSRLLVRGGSYLNVKGPAKLDVSEVGPAARIELVEGAVKLERPHLKRESFLAVGELVIEPSIEGGMVEMSISGGVVVAEVTIGKAHVVWRGSPHPDLNGEVRIVTVDGPTDVKQLEAPERRAGVAFAGTKLRLEGGVLAVTPPPVDTIDPPK